LASHATVRGCVEPLINQPVRLIESYALRREHDSVFYLHNGNSEYLEYGSDQVVQRNMSISHTFHNGRLFCMFVKVLIYLTDVATPEDGPFCYLEGSHKANWPWFTRPESVDRPALTTVNFPSLRIVAARAGDALIINEALLHGTLPKTTEEERLLMAFSYAPAFVADWKEIDKTSVDIRRVGHY
jgi:ectoine hydroxylase-related dioxygenase (phytanoyl-CoA dioxygenase family)